MAKKIPSAKSLILLAITLSIIMYLAGVFSGLYANKVLEIKVGEDIEKVEQDVDILKSYTDSAALEAKNHVSVVSTSLVQSGKQR